MSKPKTQCPAEEVIQMIGGRWKVSILHLLMGGTKRFSEIKRAQKKLSEKMLTQQLRELERDGLINRKVYPQVPPKVEYSLTPTGKSLKKVLKSMSDWGIKHL